MLPKNVEKALASLSCCLLSVTILAMLAVLAFLVVLSVLILIHEAGHYLAARLFRVKAEEFGYGLPPRAIGFVRVDGKWRRVKRGDQSSYANTIWSLNWLPIGGFVRIKGEEGENRDKDALHARPVWQRFVIVSAGVLMNWVLAAALLSIGFMVGIPAVLDDLPAGAIIDKQEVLIVDTLPGSAAAEGGIQAMDAIVAIGDKKPVTLGQAQQMIADHGTSTIALTLRRSGEDVTLAVAPEYIESMGKVALGVSLVDSGKVRYPIHLALVNGVRITGEYTKQIILTFVNLFQDLFRGGGEMVKSVSGPVGIAVLAGQVAKQGILPLLQFSAILSINLAVLNFLPIPALDGGRAVFLIVEAIRRKPVKRDVEAIIHNVAFLLLIVLVILITARDVWKFFG